MSILRVRIRQGVVGTADSLYERRMNDMKSLRPYFANVVHFLELLDVLWGDTRLLELVDEKRARDLKVVFIFTML